MKNVKVEVTGDTSVIKCVWMDLLSEETEAVMIHIDTVDKHPDFHYASRTGIGHETCDRVIEITSEEDGNYKLCSVCITIDGEHSREREIFQAYETRNQIRLLLVRSIKKNELSQIFPE